MFSVVAAESSIQLICQPPPSAMAVLCERQLLMRVFSNIIGNAIKFTPSEGSVSIAAKSEDGQIRFSVRDTGPGVPAEDLPHLFDRYWQQKESDRRGSGLGLYIAKGIVEAHGGRISAESRPGEGTTIEFTLPEYAGGEAWASPVP